MLSYKNKKVGIWFFRICTTEVAGDKKVSVEIKDVDEIFTADIELTNNDYYESAKADIYLDKLIKHWEKKKFNHIYG